MRSLARAVARGHTVRAWAIHNAVHPLSAQCWAELPDFRDIVDKIRVEHADRAVGKITGCALRAIERLVELSERAPTPSAQVTATRLILDKWVALSEYFDQGKKFLTFKPRILCSRQAERRRSRPDWGQLDGFSRRSHSRDFELRAEPLASATPPAACGGASPLDNAMAFQDQSAGAGFSRSRGS